MFSGITSNGPTEEAARIVNECAFAPSEWDEIIVESDGFCDQFAEDLKQQLQNVQKWILSSSQKIAWKR